MSGAGRVVDVQERSEPKTARPALLLLTDFDAPVGPDKLKRNAVWIERIDPHPAIGDLISWGPHHVEWNGHQLRKLGAECDPNDPTLYTG